MGIFSLANTKEAFVRVKRWFLGWLHLGPHFVVGDPNDPYLLRWYILPRNPWLNVYVHKFVKDDDDRALHDHPWKSLSILLFGRYREIAKDGATKDYGPLSVVRREAEHAHRIELPKDAKTGKSKPAWTLFFTGSVRREWGFHCKEGWRHWKEYTAPGLPGQVGKGCDD